MTTESLVTPLRGVVCTLPAVFVGRPRC